MTLQERLKHTTVLGAAGKMGSGILYLVTLYIAKFALKENNYQSYFIYAIDQSQEQLQKTIQFIKSLLLKYAEKSVSELRKLYAHRSELIYNSEIVECFVAEAIERIIPSVRLESAYTSSVVFEAVIENINLKTDLYKKISDNNNADIWFLTNTSSIPIKALNDVAQLDGKIIGCHFYNPPAVQKLIEVIEVENGNTDLKNWVYDFAKEMGKIAVPSNDVAGFIGNGFFMRDVLYAIELQNKLNKEFDFATSITIVDTLTRDFMLRPMGIFQLIDYVGVDVCCFILQVMQTHQPNENLKNTWLENILSKNIKGGQNPDGSQKQGFFKYEKGKIVEVLKDDFSYTDIKSIQEKVKNYLGDLPENQSWKSVLKNADKEKCLSNFFNKINKTETTGCQLAKEYMQAMKKIAEKLIAQKVTDNSEYVNTTMITGFHHLYGPINNFCS